MNNKELFVNALFRTLFRIFFRINIKAFDQVPMTGPLLMLTNHTSTIEGPMVYVFLHPRKVVALAKKELWEHKFTGFLMNLWHSIPVDRENMSRESMEKCFGILDKGEILAIAPEGTRNKNGNLQQGKAGVAYIAHKKQATLLPMVTLGFEKFSYNLKRLRRTPITIIVGKPFEVVQKGGRLDAEVRQKLVDEMMMRLAELMPRSQWGYYANRPIEYQYTRTIQ